jgi:hypothetical protein
MQELSVITSKPEDAENPTALLAQGTRYLQELAGDNWTDYNTHDPGLTILEHLCFALADLNFRTSFDVKDLIANAPDDEEVHRLFTAREILPSHPVTIDDYRKLIIDINGIRNAWVVPCKQPEVIYKNTAQTALNHISDKAIADASDTIQLKGLYKVLLDFEDENPTQEKIDAIKEEVKNRLAEHRNLGEDFAIIEQVLIEEIAINSEIELEAEASVDEVLAEMFERIDYFLAPSPRFYSLDELLAKKIPASEIFDGPSLENGFLLTEELPIHRTSIHTSDLMSIMMNVKGVKAIRNFHASNSPQGVLFRGGQRWCIRLNAGMNYTPRLVVSKCKPAVFKNGVMCEFNMENILQLFNEKQEMARAQKYPVWLQTDLDLPKGKFRNLQEYFSVQHDLPNNYGVGLAGLPSTASPLRRAQAHQLKAYLLVFDQLLANYQAQLSKAGKLFSNDFLSKQTYFYQLPEVTGANELYHDEPDPGNGNTNDEGKRTVRLLNHKLGRFAEQTSDHVMLTGRTIDDEIRDKHALLSEYPTLSSKRATGFNYTRPFFEKENISGFKKRICRLLGIDEYRSIRFTGEDAMETEGFHLIEHILLRWKKEDDSFLSINPIDPHNDPPWRDDPYSNLVSVIVPSWLGRFSEEGNEFRKNFENRIQLEAPAHLRVFVFWLDQTQMQNFEEACVDWLRDLKSPSPSRLVDFLNSVNNENAITPAPNFFPKEKILCLQGRGKGFLETLRLKFTMGTDANAETGIVFEWTNETKYWIFYYAQNEKKIRIDQVEDGIRKNILSTGVTNLSGANIELSLSIQKGILQCRQISPNTIGTEFLIGQFSQLESMNIGWYVQNAEQTIFTSLKVTDEESSFVLTLPGTTENQA